MDTIGLIIIITGVAKTRKKFKNGFWSMGVGFLLIWVFCSQCTVRMYSSILIWGCVAPPYNSGGIVAGQIKSSQVPVGTLVGLRDRVAIIRTLNFSSPHPYAGSGEVCSAGCGTIVGRRRSLSEVKSSQVPGR